VAQLVRDAGGLSGQGHATATHTHTHTHTTAAATHNTGDDN
jgi:hypothetical protein